MFRKFLSMLLLIAVVPVALQAQSPEERIEAAFARAAQEGLPVALMKAKLNEGWAKGIAAARIADAIDRQEAALLRARDVLQRGDREVEAADLAVAADALSAGISAAILETIDEKAPRERRAVAIVALTELVYAGHVPQEALDRVVDALERGPDALASLSAEAAQARALRGPPAGLGAPMGPGGVAGPPSGVPAPGQRPAAAGNRPGGGA